MTQIANLRPIDGTRTTLQITKNARLQFSIFFPYPAGPQVPLIAPASMAVGSPTLSNLPTATVASLVTGQVVGGYGIPAGATILAIPSATSVTLSAGATQAGAAIGVTFQPVPLDLTGISFRMQILRQARSANGSGNVLLELSTDNGRLINGGTSGVLSGDVAPVELNGVPVTAAAQSFPTDIVATAPDGGPINLMAQSGPASVTVVPGVTL